MRKSRTLGWLCGSLLALAGAMACQRTRPAAPRIIPAADGAADDDPLATPRHEGPKRVEDASVPAPDTNAVRALEVATEERRVFRHLLVGALRYPPERFTWVLYRGATRAHLDVFCQTGTADSARGMRLDGHENAERSWRPPTVSRYVGTRSDATPLYRFTAESTPHGVAGCERAPSAFTMSCRSQKVAVRPAGVVLVPGGRRNDGTEAPARWNPPRERSVDALRCEIQQDASAPSWPLASEPALIFSATSPGIEWAHENSDMVAQAGAYREILPAP